MKDLTNAIPEFIMPKSSQRSIRLADDSSCPIPAEPTHPEQAWAQGSSDPDRVDVSRLDVPPAIFDEHSDPAQELTGRETRADVVRLALKKERYMIGYYVSLTEFALGRENIKVIKNILQEEKEHVRILMQSLRQTTG
jgi:hypothetical protein